MRKTIYEILGSSKSLKAIPLRQIMLNVQQALLKHDPNGKVTLAIPSEWANDLLSSEPKMQFLIVSVSREDWDNDAERIQG